ncbi:MAG: response regulator, partial [Rhodospirillaceae bacterium]|nr:response regulator [Rhodospirillaceae bacterium]
PAAAVVMDIMSEADRDAGLVEVRALRKSGVIKCPVIFLTVRDDFKARLEAVRGGADSFLVKPVNILELVSAIDRLSSRGKVAPFKAVIVDDHEEMAKYFEVLLTKAGFLVEVVTAPENALAVILDTMPDVILLDIHMPKCNGIELAKVIRQTNSQLFRRPIVFITGDMGDEKRVLTVRSGGDDLLSKPVDPDYLIASVMARAERSREISAINARLMSSEEMFRAVAQTAGDGILSCNHDGVVVFTNVAADGMFGLEAEKFLGHRITGLFSDVDDFEKVRAVAGEALEDGVHTMELEMSRTNGETFPAEITATHWDVHDGRYFTLIVRDITERKRAAEALEHNARVLETTLNTIDQGFVMWAQNKTLVSWNKMCEDIWYCPPNLRSGMPMRELLLHIAQNGGLGDGDHEALADAEFGRLVAEGTESEDEFRLPDGRAIFVRRFPLPDGGYVATYMDVTHIRRLEEDLHQARGGD